MPLPLDTYRRKRDPAKTPEPIIKQLREAMRQTMIHAVARVGRGLFGDASDLTLSREVLEAREAGAGERFRLNQQRFIGFGTWRAGVVVIGLGFGLAFVMRAVLPDNAAKFYGLKSS